MIFLGVDPGLDGAIAAFDSDDQAVDVFDMPTIEVQRTKGNKREVDVVRLAARLNRFCDECRVDQAVIEQAQIIPGTGQITQIAQTWHNFGVVKGVLAAQVVPVEYAVPAKWKAAFGLGRVKEASRVLASRMAPQFSGLWPLKKHEGRAEAVLLAFYAERVYRARHGGPWPRA